MSFTPMMKQYLDIKKQYSDCLLFFRLGDFYELFFEDAVIASRELEIVLTGRDAGQEERVPMCGVPYHSAQGYIAKLLSRGYKVAICEQVEDPKKAKGLVKREVTKIYTPGTVTEEFFLQEKTNNYIIALAEKDGLIALAVAEVSTGYLGITSVDEGKIEVLASEIRRLAPTEAVVLKNFKKNFLLKDITGIVNYLEKLPAEEIEIAFKGPEASKEAYKILISYLKRIEPAVLSIFGQPEFYQIDSYLYFDESTRKNLEILRNREDNSSSLLGIIDFTQTAMGARKLKEELTKPLLNLKAITDRLDAVEILVKDYELRENLRENLKNLYDLERLSIKLVCGTINPKDLIKIKQSLPQIWHIKNSINHVKNKSVLFAEIYENLPEMREVYNLIDKSIVDDPPGSPKDGGIIKNGYNSTVDEYRKAREEGQDWIINYEKKERERTGIKSLKVNYNKVFGYFIEVTKANLHLVPADYQRKQTMVNAERFITEELKHYENLILGASEKLANLEYELFCEIRSEILKYQEDLKRAASAVALLDFLISLAVAAIEYDFTRPVITAEPVLEIKNGRHPVVEKSVGRANFVPNDLYLDTKENSLLLITGPNMAGKSTYMRQAALIVILAQIGSFVPAEYARVGLVDKILTRIGATDDLAKGQSTFMVEMIECNNILRNATSRSLILLDEVGRGTSTYDGISIAEAIIEYIQKKIKARTLFSTHYHELTGLEGEIPGVKNFTVLVQEKGEEVKFLHKVVPGKTDKSYGIYVAKLAGLPREVVERAYEILARFEDKGLKVKDTVPVQLSLFEEKPEPSGVIKELIELDLIRMTPLEALNKLYELRQKALGEK
ncbi:DNA mismatch repair protein MutS [Carboxydothermus ferrireducens]|uniref:DNA mismatch repair protein MutS n=1 Tax=Carboxydothermus ferrireducens DSM 11255 TaxID=1119529 RepID=A0ABX2RDJ0_9THEO|nr:DNA mismatch repair protein MutS [Carboxydothermus ferrireducens]NYE58166.1 DNA mismatch repair protein MutS [Carboxydothermus ferrireducens DSM 11255]